MIEGAWKEMMMVKHKATAAVIGAVLVWAILLPAAQGLELTKKQPGKKQKFDISWGQAKKGLQVGLVPLGGEVDKDWGSTKNPFFCRKCVNQARKPVMDPSVAADKRCCSICGKVKPWSLTFIEGQPLRLEVHLRNSGKEALKTSGYALLHARWQPVWQVEASDVRRTFVSRPATPRELPMAMPGMVYKAPDLRQPGWHWARVVGFAGPAWRFMPKGKNPAGSDPMHLPAGKYTLKITFSSAGAGADKTVWKGKVSSASVEIEIKAAEAAKPGTIANAWQNLFSAKRWYKNQKGPEQVFKGKLISLKAGGISTLMRTSHYKLGDRTIYTGARKVAELDELIGKTIEIRGKAVNMNLEGRSLKEIWPGAFRVAK
jgi:hypothetical protein